MAAMAKRLAWAACVVLVAVAVFLLAGPIGSGAPEGAWGKLTRGSPAASAPIVIPNADFEKEGLVAWRQLQQVIEKPAELPEGGIRGGSGRGGSAAFHHGPVSAKRGSVAAEWTAPVSHADWFLDGHLRLRAASGAAWAAIELAFEDGSGTPIASYFAWKGEGGTAPPAGEGKLVVEMEPSEGNWWRVPIRTTHDLREHGLALPRPPTFISVRLRLFVADGEAEAWFDDLELRDMKAMR
jgi:hypothetical protein